MTRHRKLEIVSVAWMYPLTLDRTYDRMHASVFVHPHNRSAIPVCPHPQYPAVPTPTHTYTYPRTDICTDTRVCGPDGQRRARKEQHPQHNEAGYIQEDRCESLIDCKSSRTCTIVRAAAKVQNRPHQHNELDADEMREMPHTMKLDSLGHKNLWHKARFFRTKTHIAIARPSSVQQE
jgi:hypothetical protein